MNVNKRLKTFTYNQIRSHFINFAKNFTYPLVPVPVQELDMDEVPVLDTVVLEVVFEHLPIEIKLFKKHEFINI